MFYFLTLTRDLEIAPRFLGAHLREEIVRRLRAEVEGSCDGRHGFIVAVPSVESVGKGMVREGVGSAVFAVTYSAVSFMPHRGEVLDAVVKSVNKMGFFAEAGPLAVFVSNHLIPEEFEFDTGGEPCYASAADGRRLAPGAEVRLRVVGTRVDAREIFAVGTVKDDYLGLLEARAGA